MAYTPTEWSTGDTITASAMNKIENGIAGAGSALIVRVTYEDSSWFMDKTFAEIFNAIAAGIPCYLTYNNVSDGADLDETYAYLGICAPITIAKYNLMYRVYVYNIQGQTINSWDLGTPSVMTFTVNEADEYPMYLKTAYVDSTSMIVHGNFIN